MRRSRSGMYGNRGGGGRYGNQQGGSLLGNANAGNIMMANQMAGMANIQLLSQASGQHGRASQYPMDRSLRMQDMQQPGGYGVGDRRSMPLHGLDPVLDIVPRRSAASEMRRGRSFDRRGGRRPASSFSPPMKRSRPADDDDHGDGDGHRPARNKFKCQVCRLQFDSINEFDSHMDSDGHAANMKVMSAVYHDKNQQLLTTTVDNRMTRKSPGADRNGMCSLCMRSFGKFSPYEHNRSKQHQHREFLVKKGCKLCNMNGFDNYPAYVNHIDSADHKQKKQELSKRTTAGAASPSPEKSSGKSPTETVAVPGKKPTPNKEPADAGQKSLPLSSEKTQNVDDLPTQSEESNVIVVLDADDQLDELVYNPDVAVGVDQVISVTGYFCKLCHKFYNNETMARITHCKSQAHFDKYLEHHHQKMQVKPSSSSSVQEVSTTHRDMAAKLHFVSPRSQ